MDIVQTFKNHMKTLSRQTYTTMLCLCKNANYCNSKYSIQNGSFPDLPLEKTVLGERERIAGEKKSLLF